MADECGFDYVLTDPYFKVLDDKTETKATASELPDGHAWSAKLIVGTIIYTLVYSTAMTFQLVKILLEGLAREFNLYTSVELLYTVWGPSVGLPDTRLPGLTESVCDFRKQVKDRLSKQPIVSLDEIQDKLNEALPDSGIWLKTGQVGQQFRYKFRYPFGHVDGIRKRFTIEVHIPWFFIDPADPDNSQMTWEDLQDWLREFVPAFDLLKPIYEEEDSYCIITDPQNNNTVFLHGDGAGNWDPVPVQWMQIDVDTTVTHHNDTEAVTPASSEIVRSFTDSTSTLIEGENNIIVAPII